MVEVILKGTQGSNFVDTYVISRFNANVTLKSDGGIFITIHSKRLSTALDMFFKNYDTGD